MTPPIDTNRPAPTSTKPPVDPREAAKARAHAPSGNEAPAKKSTGGIAGMVERAKARAKDAAASRDAKDGADSIGEVVRNQPTPERAVVAGAAHVVTKVVGFATAPMRREVGEAAREVGNAGGNVVDTVKDGAGDLIREVGAAWDSQPTIERKIVVAGKEVIENAVQSGVRTAGSVLNAGREVAEGALEIVLNNPVNAATTAAASWAGRGVLELGGNVMGWFGDRISGGARGAVEAGKTGVDTGRSIWSRTIGQARENVTEIAGSVVNIGSTQVNNAREMAREVSDAWNADTTIERRIAGAGYEAVENAVQGTVRTVASVANVPKEIGEAAVENVITAGQNVGDAVAGGFEAAGDFIGGLFG
jgi:hypothetical protein